MMENSIIWLKQYESLWIGLGLLSLFLFVFSLLLLPWLIAQIPEDYFQQQHSPANWTMLLKPLNLLRNSLGFWVLLMGIAMLVLPGQGIITIIVGLAIMNFPGKYELERWFIKRKGVLSAINWLRAKTHTPPLRVD